MENWKLANFDGKNLIYITYFLKYFLYKFEPYLITFFLYNFFGIFVTRIFLRLFIIHIIFVKRLTISSINFIFILFFIFCCHTPCNLHIKFVIHLLYICNVYGGKQKVVNDELIVKIFGVLCIKSSIV